MAKSNSYQQPYLSDPEEVMEEIYFKVPPKKEKGESFQEWSGYQPDCTLEDPHECQFVPLQTANIKTNKLYKDIEHEGDRWARLACEVALESVKNSGGPFGAAILQVDEETNRIIRYWTNHNQVTRTYDPSAHAEVMTIRSACHSLGVFDLGHIDKKESQLEQPGALSYCVIYSSCEPCPMCYSAVSWARIPVLCFAATRFDAAVQGVNFSDEELYNELEQSYIERERTCCQCTTDNSLDAFNLWKRTAKVPY
ncbi:nucleoside deaminase [Spirochaeta cellobiosiphila]|uniref:nucleoside deaminase n=1 Tax=Spirochaeta cellobiosiphila TaxID=504483 RepID=UPI00042A2584|nr:nucleoside deaminase [Spirochaeta cellobiosiphila]